MDNHGSLLEIPDPRLRSDPTVYAENYCCGENCGEDQSSDLDMFINSHSGPVLGLLSSAWLTEKPDNWFFPLRA